jgi:PKD repeat protein
MSSVSYLYKTILVTVFATVVGSACAQNESNNWYFGNWAGLDFSSTPPTPLEDGKLFTREGCSSISDDNGDLLFYTNGVVVWNKNHDTMFNAIDLAGGISSTQSAIIIPKPESNTTYYIFTVDQDGHSKGLSYSEVDMTLDAGNGAVTGIKNVKLLAPTCEMVTAGLHENGKDVWVVSHGAKGSGFYSYLITKTGVNPTPVVSSLGRNITGDSSKLLGSIKLSPDGNRLAVSHFGYFEVQLLDFDRNTGKLSNVRTISESYTSNPYGVEFSPKGNLLYVSLYDDGANILQYNLEAPDVNASKIKLGNANYFAGTLQLGPDRKLYVALENSPFIGVISQPNEYGTGANYSPNGIYLKDNKCKLGLPQFVQSYFIQVNFKVDQNCKGADVTFIPNVSYYDSFEWNFGDLQSGSMNTADSSTPTHVYEENGTYNVHLTVFKNGAADTASRSIPIVGPTIDLGQDRELCKDSVVTLNAFTNGATYEWQDMSNNSVFDTDTSGEFWVTITVDGCSHTDTIEVFRSKGPQLNLGKDTSICIGDTITLSTNTPGDNIIWSNGSAEENTKVWQPGKYWVRLESTCYLETDSIQIDYYDPPILNLGKDTTLCAGDSFLISPGMDSYLWQDGSTQNTFTATYESRITVEASNNFCSIKDSIKLDWMDVPVIGFPEDTTLCENEVALLFATNRNSTYSWHNGSTLDRISLDKPGNYSVEVTNQCGSTWEDVDVYYKDCMCNVYVPNAFTPNYDFHNNDFGPSIDCDISAYSFKVYNRWGELVFESMNLGQQWDGMESPIGTYIWVLSFKGWENGMSKNYNLKGQISLLK